MSTVTPVLPKTVPFHLIGNRQPTGGAESLSITEDGAVPNLARGMAVTLEKSLEVLFPTLHCRCTGYIRQTTIPITVAYEHEGTLGVFAVAASAEQAARMSLLELHDYLLQQASNEVLTQLGKHPEV